jgi:hypothetical protein
MSLVHNERLKLAANRLNTIATASVTIGVIAPLAAFIYGLSATTRPVWSIALSAPIRLLNAGALHYAAQKLLGRLRP